LRACWRTRVVGKWEGGELTARRTSCGRVLGQVPPQRFGPTTFPTERAGRRHHVANAVRQETRWFAVRTWYRIGGRCSMRFNAHRFVFFRLATPISVISMFYLWR
jgi:hypothetical protein